MTYDSRELARVRGPALAICAMAWALLLAGPAGLVHAHSPAHLHHAGAAALSMLPSMAASWLLMLLGMMTPVLVPPIRHIRRRSFASRRSRSTALFVAAYGAIWMAAGAGVLPLELGLKSIAPESYGPAIGAAVIAAVWQCSPMKQRCLNRCHANRELAAFGLAADCDAVRFGMTQGAWCVGSCWALMLLSMLLPGGGQVSMFLAAVLIVSERIEPARAPSWQWRGMGMALRAAVAQLRMRVQASRAGNA